MIESFLRFDHRFEYLAHSEDFHLGDRLQIDLQEVDDSRSRFWHLSGRSEQSLVLIDLDFVQILSDLEVEQRLIRRTTSDDHRVAGAVDAKHRDDIVALLKICNELLTELVRKQ